MEKNIELIDTHCHLNYDYAPKSIDDLVNDAKAVGVSHLITIGADLESMSEIARISDRYPNVYHSAGVHPHEAITMGKGPSDLNFQNNIKKLANALAHPKCRALGEIGLDYHYDHSSPDQQKLVLQSQLDLALELKKPVIIHSRDAEKELLEMLRDYARQVAGGCSVGIIHCFTGTLEFGKSCLDLGFLVSFSGILTFKKADEIRQCAQTFPLDRLLVETDSPYLAPIPHRGKKCEPMMVRLTAQKLSEVKGVSFDEIAIATTKNAKDFFKLS